MREKLWSSEKVWTGSLYILIRDCYYLSVLSVGNDNDCVSQLSTTIKNTQDNQLTKRKVYFGSSF
jgi:hypothetical protein